MGCREICSNYSVKKINPKFGGMYELGHKRCAICETFLNWEGIHCPCCGTSLRSKPRNSQGRDKLGQTIRAQHSSLISKFKIK